MAWNKKKKEKYNKHIEKKKKHASKKVAKQCIESSQ